MPELPEVETMVRGIRPVLEGRRIATVRRCRCRCRPIAIRPTLARLVKRIRGKTVTAVGRLGKRIVIELSSSDRLVIEPRMTGLLLIRDPPDREHLRLEWQFEDGNQNDRLRFWDRRGLGTVRLYRPREFEIDLGPTRLGPDALEMTTRDWAERCGRTRRQIKVLLLDQKVVAGIGNLYAAEILHRAGIHPACRADRLTPARIRKLAAAARSILTTAIKYEGSTLSDGTYRNALNRAGGYQNQHRVYGRADSLCRTCGQAPVVRTIQAQRSTFFCPLCQPVDVDSVDADSADVDSADVDDESASVRLPC